MQAYGYAIKRLMSRKFGYQYFMFKGIMSDCLMYLYCFVANSLFTATSRAGLQSFAPSNDFKGIGANNYYVRRKKKNIFNRDCVLQMLNILSVSSLKLFQNNLSIHLICVLIKCRKN